MANATITGTASNFGSISGVLAGEAGTVAGTITGTVSGTLTGSVGVPGAGVPSGGTTGQVLKKVSNTDYDTTWGTDLASAAWGTITGTLSSQTDLQTALNLKADLASPALTGNPTAPTAATGDSDTTIATTAFVQQELAAGTAIAKSLEVYVRNQTGATLTAGTIVYINGATGNRPTVTKAQANNDANSAQTFGFVKTSIANNGFGYVIVRGEVENIDTSALTEGQQLYLSPTTAGTWTTTKPYAPDHLVYVGIVIRSHPTQGVILVAIQNGYELDEIHDVKITTPTNGQVLKYDSAQGLWVNGTDSSGVAWGGITGTLSAQTDLQNALDAKAPLASPALTGTPTAPTASANTNTTQLATTAFVLGQGNTTAATIVMNGTQAAGTSNLYARADHVHPTDTTLAPKASPALTGTPTAPTAAAATNTTQIATTAFVQQEVPAASTTAAGKVELATNAEAIATTSTTLVPALATLPAILAKPELRSLAHISLTAIANSGTVTSSVVAWGVREMYLSSLGVGRAAFLYSNYGTLTNLWSRADRTKLDFSKKIWMAGKCSLGFTVSGTSYLGDANTMSRITLGGYTTNTTGDMSQKGIGFKKVGGTSSAISLTVHNGTTLTDVATTKTCADGEVIDWVIYSDGTGNVTLFINGTQEATTSAGPTGTTTAGYNSYREQVEATSTPGVRGIIHATGGWIYVEG